MIPMKKIVSSYFCNLKVRVLNESLKLNFSSCFLVQKQQYAKIMAILMYVGTKFTKMNVYDSD